MTSIVLNDLKTSYSNRKLSNDRLQGIYDYAGESILDVGCGNGKYVYALQDKYYIRGVDYERFSSWEEKPELFNICDANNLSLFADNSFDTVTCFEMLEHMENYDKVLSELNRICRKNIIISVPNCTLTDGLKNSNLIYSHWIDPTHIHYFTKDTIEEIIKKANFEIEETRFINPIRNLKYFITEAFNVKGINKLLLKYLIYRFLKYDKYRISILVVANKK